MWCSLPWNPSTGGLGGGVHVLAGVRDVRGGGDLRQRQGPDIAAGAVGRRRAHRHGDDLRRRPHLRRAHEPRRHARVRRLPPFPLDSGTRSIVTVVIQLQPAADFVFLHQN